MDPLSFSSKFQAHRQGSATCPLSRKTPVSLFHETPNAELPSNFTLPQPLFQHLRKSPEKAWRGDAQWHTPQLRDISHTNIVASSWDPLGHQEFHWFATVPQFVADNLHFWGCITALHKHKVWVCHSIHLYILCMYLTHCLDTKTDTEELLVMLHEFRSGFFICLFDGKIFNFCWR